jgi:dual-specificity kinase
VLNSVVAIKKSKGSKFSIAQLELLKELKRRDTSDSHHICHILDSYVDVSTIYVVFPFFARSLSSVIKHGPLPLTQIRLIARQLLEALAFLHENNIIHADIKPDNIMLIEGKVNILKEERKVRPT